MQTRIINLPKQKTWGIVENPHHPGHFYTGYVGMWGDWQSRNRAPGKPEDFMVPNKNAIITGDFKMVSMSRGRSAANFHGHFRGHEEVSYELGMKSTYDIVEALQYGRMQIVDGYISGTWSFAKQGCDIFLKPYTEA